MAKLNIAPTKSNLLSMKEQLSVSKNGYDLLEEKREILVRELMHMVERVKLLERDIDKKINEAYPVLKRMLMSDGSDQIERISHAIHYDFNIAEKRVIIGGMPFSSIDVELPKKELFYSLIGTYANTDETIVKFFELLSLLTQMASIRTIVWRLAEEVKKTQRRVNALDKMIIPQAEETKLYIEGVLEERERENVFVLKALKKRSVRKEVEK
ncbi:MAG: V-type ATP synthase subunit D [Treponema sp.]|jgi:V/A-type H+/Na+-transporting ATPase subunit D|nr:V-type ATP synthase subunit D [Treponema sp.]